MAFSANAQKGKTASKPSKEASSATENMQIITPGGVRITYLKKGNGERPTAGDRVTVHYVGRFPAGKIFDSSRESGKPFTFNLGKGEVIKGWDEAIPFLGKGDKATVIIPSEMGYGAQGAGSTIPPNSVLQFEIELIDFTVDPKKPFNTQGKTMKTTESGLQYTIVEAHKGEKPKAGDKVSVHYTGRLADGKVFDSSVDRGEPIQFTLGVRQVIPGWDEGIALLSKGDKATFVIPPALAYGSQGAGGVIPPNATLTFDVELVDFTPKVEVKPYDTTHVKAATTASGLRYFMISSKGGPKAASGDKVKVHYTGRLMDGKVFDSSVERGEPIEFNLGEGRVIPGWEEGIALLGKGDKATLVIPAELAYGAQGAGGVIPPNATLVFDVELVDFTAAPKVEQFDIKGKPEKTTPSGLKYIVVKEGTGPQATAGQSAMVHYSGYLLDGKMFDSSVKRGEPFTFQLGQGGVIAGWDEGVALMKVGAKYRFIIPASLGYGANGAGGVIPPNATLIFDVELLGLK